MTTLLSPLHAAKALLLWVTRYVSRMFTAPWTQSIFCDEHAGAVRHSRQGPWVFIEYSWSLGQVCSQDSIVVKHHATMPAVLHIQLHVAAPLAQAQPIF